MKFRRKPEEVEAVQWMGDNWDEVKAFVGDRIQRLGDKVRFQSDAVDAIVDVSVTDWFIKQGIVINKLTASQFGANYGVASCGQPYRCGGQNVEPGENR